MMSDLTHCTNCFKNLGVPSRMEIFDYLRENGECTVTEIVKQVGLTQPTISYHLKEMKNGGMLSSHKKGKEVFYSIRPHCPHHNKKCILEAISSSNK